MNNAKQSQFTVTRRDVPSARRASALRPEDRPSGLRPTAPAQEEDVPREDELEKANDES
jgi:hypothetical protein